MSDSDIFGSDTDIISQTPVKENIIPRKKHRKKKIINTKRKRNCWFQKEYVKKEEELDFNDEIISDFPYVFYEIKDILNFDLKFCPINSYVKTIGKFILKDGETYLEQFFGSLKIKLIFPNEYPKLNSMVEIFGHINFGARLAFQIKFWKAIDCDLQQYLSCLKQLKSTVPLKYLKTGNKMLKDDSELTLVGNKTFSFNEEDESLLVRNVEAYEEYCSEINRLLSVDSKIFL